MDDIDSNKHHGINSAEQTVESKDNKSEILNALIPLPEYKSRLNFNDLSNMNRKQDLKGKNFPSQIFINQEFYKSFNVSKAKIEYNVDGELSEIAEIAFKNRRRQLYCNNNKLPLLNYQFVIVEAESGYDIGTVTAFGKCAETKLKLNYKDNAPTTSIIRHAKLEDMEKHKKNIDDVNNVLIKARDYISKFDLEMKLTDAEWQLDHQRLTFFFTAPTRIDFRLLVKELARVFHTRIELRQISSREEAKRIGGMGPCGRDLCCSSFSQDHCHVTLEHARIQQMSNNVAKLSGYCGRLKCCLLYEFNTYVETFNKYPSMNSEIEFPEGKAKILKADIFSEQLHTYISETSAYKTISFEEFTNMYNKGKVTELEEGSYKNHGFCRLINHDEDDIEELKKLEDNEV